MQPPHCAFPSSYAGRIRILETLRQTREVIRPSPNPKDPSSASGHRHVAVTLACRVLPHGAGQSVSPGLTQDTLNPSPPKSPTYLGFNKCHISSDSLPVFSLSYFPPSKCAQIGFVPLRVALLGKQTPLILQRTHLFVHLKKSRAFLELLHK